MCGLIGQFTFAPAQAEPAQREIVRALLARVARRGPDGEGFWSDGAHCTLGSRRLAIVDLGNSAAQPMVSRDGRHVLVYNGMLYNFRELRDELASAGARFRSSGDAEVVLQALAHWGTAALQRMNGMFAIALYDARDRRLVLARDHAGMKPLYYLRTPAGIAFASQFDQILAHPWARGRGLSGEGLGLYLRLGYIPAPYAALEGAHQLEAGSWLEIAADGSEDGGRFFAFPRWREADLRGADADDAVSAAVAAAVRRHMVADVPVGAFLSGGVDSPLVAATMGAVGAEPLHAFTVGTGGDVYDESRDAALYASEIGAEHHIEQLAGDDVLLLLDDAVSACPEPFADYSIFPTLVVARLARRHVVVALSGDGGDELFWGYVGRSAAVLGRLLGRLTQQSERRWDWQRLLTASADETDPRWPRSLGDVQRMAHCVSEGWLRSAFPDLPPWPSDFDLFAYDGRDIDRTAQWLRWNEFCAYLPSILQKVDRGSMYHSLEVRVPLLDREVIEVAQRVDWRACLDTEQRLGKLPLRRALSRHMSSQTVAKRGFTVPMAAWLRGPLQSVFVDAVLGRRSLAGLPMDEQAVRRRFERHLQGGDETRSLWTLLSLALWEDRYGKTTVRSVS